MDFFEVFFFFSSKKWQHDLFIHMGENILRLCGTFPRGKKAICMLILRFASAFCNRPFRDKGGGNRRAKKEKCWLGDLA